MKNKALLFAIAGLLVAGVAAWFILSPIFFSKTVLASPDRLSDVVERNAFTEITREAGFTHVHQKPQLDAKVNNIMPWLASVGSAAAAGDYDNDGWMDLYVTNSRRGTPNFLYRNKSDGTFEEVAGAAGLADVNNESGISTDAVWGDYDNDGHVDLYVVKWGRDQLFRNNGDGSFSDVTEQAFPGGINPWANGCAAIWFDFTGDQHLDLYVGNYFAPHDLWQLTTTNIMHDDFEKSRNAGGNFMYINNGDGTFREVAEKLGLDDTGWTLSMGHGDINNDGLQDIYSANDFGTDMLFLNQGGSRFADVTDQVFGGDTKKGMNVDLGDFDNNGWLDIYVTNITTKDYLKEGNMLWHNDAADESGVPIFLDISVESGTFDGGWGWGAKFFDFDNDRDLDIITLNGFITAGPESYWYDLASWTVTGDDVTDATAWPTIGDRSFSGNEAARLFRNDGGHYFREIAEEAGVANRMDGRGAVVFDYDNDGDLDLYMAIQGGAPAFYRNDVGNARNWLALDLTGNPASGSNREGIGARATIVTAGGNQIRELDGGNSFCGQSDRRLYFGLGNDKLVKTLEIRWPSGGVQVLENIEANQILRVTEPADTLKTASLIPTKRDSMPVIPEVVKPEIDAAEAEVLLADLEKQIQAAPNDVVIASRYRQTSVAAHAYDRSVAFFEQMVAARPENRYLRLQLSGAYIDKLPTCGGVAAVVSKGTLARKALDQLDVLLKHDSNWWPARYSRAMNHLHWPRALRHSDDAAADARAMIEIQKNVSKRSFHVRAHVILGDALAKDGDVEAARKAWQEGMRLYPDHPGLRERVALQPNKIRDFIEDKRNLEENIDTDFSFLVAP
ncbi:MAG: FG-GAP-like repeat-containing protein [Acidobacteriota bacterium]|nr:FG-GAP-like repeat-containing protein [Acidobacteriota bacterium]